MANLPNISSIEQLMSFNQKSLLPVQPFPTPPKPKPLGKTSFQLTPFSETILIDPYDTIPLNTLTEAQISIDNTISYLESIIPNELLDIIQNSADVLDFLVKTGQSLEQVVSNLVDTLGSALSSVLRAIPFMAIVNNIGAFVSSLVNVGLNIVEMSANFIVTGLSIMHSISSVINTTLAIADSIGNAIISTINGISNLASNIIGSIAVTIASIGEVLSNPISFLNTLSGIGIASAQFLNLVSNIGSTAFGIVSVGVQTLGLELAMPVIAVANAVNTIGYVATSNIVSLLTRVPANTLGVLSLINTIGIDNSTLIYNNQVVSSGILTDIGLYTFDSVANVVKTIAKIGVDAYLLTDSSGTYSTIINDISTYGIILVSTLTNLASVYSSSTISSLLTNFTTLGTTDSATIISLATAYTPSVINSITAGLNVSDVSTIASLLTNISNTINNPSGVTAIGSLSSSDTKTLLNVLLSIDCGVLNNCVSIVNSLSSANVSLIAGLISNNEPYTSLSGLTLSDTLLNYCVRTTAEIAALKGNYQAVLNLLSSYTGVITSDYKLYLVTTILNNFKLTQDYISMGLTNVANEIIKALDIIFPKWYLIKRNNEYVINHYPFLTASNDALSVLLCTNRFSISSILQKDNNYSL